MFKTIDTDLSPTTNQWGGLTAAPYVDAVDEETGEITRVPTHQVARNNVDGLLIHFDYADVSGFRSSRGLACHSCWYSHGTIYVRGYCTLRKAFRTFRADRMSDVHEMRTEVPIAKPLYVFAGFALNGAKSLNDTHGTKDDVVSYKALALICGLVAIIFWLALRG
jgi:predicted DNA-binding transcriptional regulator YafY